MTHSLHRSGTKGALKTDYVLLAMLAAGINDTTPDAKQKLLQIGDIFDQNTPTNIMMEELRYFSPVITAVYADTDKVKNVLQTLKQKDLGVSIVVSGLISEIQKITKEVGLKIHTAHFSLGVFGKKELLPPENILEITTMCGHHCVSPQSVEHYVEQIKKGQITFEYVAQQLSKPCICGIVNPTRLNNLLQELVEQK